MAEYTEKEALIAHIKDLPTWWADAGGVYGRSMKYPEGMFDCEDVISSVENAPAADVAPVRHGRWEDSADEWFGTDVYTCSKCRESYVLVEGTPKENLWHYCPNCGAKMDGDMNE